MSAIIIFTIIIAVLLFYFYRISVDANSAINIVGLKGEKGGGVVELLIESISFQSPSTRGNMDGWLRALRFSTVFQKDDGNVNMKDLRSEAPFRFGKNLASSGIRTLDPVIRSRER